MRIVADADRAQPELPRQLHRALHPAIGPQRALGIVGVQNLDRAKAAGAAQVGIAVQPPALKRLDIMRQKPDTVAVDAKARAMQHGACRGLGGGVVGTDGQKGRVAKARKL